MDNKWDLKSLYPDRELFHVMEFLTLGRLSGEYFMRLGDLDAAESVLDAMKDVAPDHEATEQLDLTLREILLLKLMDRFKRFFSRRK